MKTYVNPELEVKELSIDTVITASADIEGDGDGWDQADQ